MEADDYNPHLREEAIARHNEAVKASVATIIELGHAKERIATLEVDRITQAESVVHLREELAGERLRRKELELILENVAKAIKATLGP